jgi:hypothetical protein
MLGKVKHERKKEFREKLLADLVVISQQSRTIPERQGQTETVAGLPVGGREELWAGKENRRKWCGEEEGAYHPERFHLEESQNNMLEDTFRWDWEIYLCTV